MVLKRLDRSFLKQGLLLVPLSSAIYRCGSLKARSKRGQIETS